MKSVLRLLQIRDTDGNRHAVPCCALGDDLYKLYLVSDIAHIKFTNIVSNTILTDIDTTDMDEYERASRIFNMLEMRHDRYLIQCEPVETMVTLRIEGGFAAVIGWLKNTYNNKRAYPEIDTKEFEFLLAGGKNES